MEPTNATSSAEQLLTAYEEFGYKLVKVDPAEKHPKYKKWQLKTVTPEELRRWIGSGGNVGIQAGEVSDWICAADLDCPEAIELASKFLSETLKSGKEGIASHWVYRSHGAPYLEFHDVDGSILIQLKASANGAGHQFVVEPSVHPEKGPYRWIPAFNPALIAEFPKEKLERRLRYLAVAVLIVRNFPPDGGHRYANALCGFLLRNGMPLEDLQYILEACWPKEKANRHNVAGAASGTHAKLERDEPVTGGRTLEGLAPGLPKALAKALGWQKTDNRDGRCSYLRTDTGNAQRFADRHGPDVHYVYSWRKWLVYDGKRWKIDSTGEVERRAKETARSIFEEAARTESDEKARELGKWALQSQSAARIQAMIELARSEPGIPVTPDELDQDPYLFNCSNGTIDLRTGEPRSHSREDLISKITEVEYDPQAEAPTWEAFLERVQPNAAVRGFLKRAAGYSATGDTSEQCMFINHGSGANGKSTGQEALMDTLGDYAMKTPTEMLLAKRSEGVPNDIARLKGARFVAASETEDGRRLAESLVKDLTGSDTITARFMRAEWFDFRPTHKLHLATNHKPEIRGTDNAIWRRIRLIPWTVTIPIAQQDHDLPKKLRKERAGILRWIVDGAIEWYREGLKAPDEVRKATGQYRAEMDVQGNFVRECCEKGGEYKVAAKDLYEAYKLWCEENGEHYEKQRKFSNRLNQRGEFERRRSGPNGSYEWHGLQLLNYWKSAICRKTEPTEAKITMNGSKPDPREDMGNFGSDGSEGSADKVRGRI